MNNKKVILNILIVSLILINLFINGVFGKDKIDILAVSGSSGGSWYSIMGSIAEIIKQGDPSINIKATPGHSFTNIIRIASNEAQLGFTFPMWIAQAVEHSGDFAERPKIEEGTLLAIAGGFGSSPMQFVVDARFAEKYEIESVKDLIEKKVPMKLTISLAGTHSPWVMEKIFDFYGAVFPDDIEKWGGVIHWAGYTEQTELMKDGHADVLAIDVNPPASTIVEVQLSRELKFLTLPQEAIDYMTEKQGHVYELIPAHTYKNQDFDLPTVTMLTVLITNDKLPEEVAYSIVKILDKEKETLQKISVALEEFDTKTSWENLIIPLHPGAEKAYRELNYIK